MNGVRHRSGSRGTTRPLNIIHLPTDVGGNAQNLSRQMNRIGANSTSLVTYGSYFKYGGDTVLGDAGTNRLIREMKKLRALGYIFRHDVVFFNFGQTLYAPTAPQSTDYLFRRSMRYIYDIFNRIMQRIELRVLEMRGCTLLIQYQGDDARQGDVLRERYSYSHVDEVESGYYTRESDEHKRKQISLIAPKCHRVYALNPDLLSVLLAGAEFLPYAHIDLDEWIPDYQPRRNGVLRLGHAPTHRAAKGTKYVLEAVDHLRSQGWPIELVLVEGMSNAEAREVYASVDVLVDQLLVGWYGGLAVELMALGKPVIAYLRDADLVHIPSEMAHDLPVIIASAETLEKQLVSLMKLSNDEWASLQRRSRMYVEKWHNPQTIAHRILADTGRATDRSTPTNGEATCLKGGRS